MAHIEGRHYEKFMEGLRWKKKALEEDLGIHSYSELWMTWTVEIKTRLKGKVRAIWRDDQKEEVEYRVLLTE